MFVEPNTIKVKIKRGSNQSSFTQEFEVPEQDNQTVVLRGLDGQDISLERKDIKTINAQGVSLMPAGLLTEYTDDQVRDLMAYLRSTQPLNN